MEQPVRDQLLQLFRRYGVQGAIKEIVPRGQDEAIFVVDAVAAAQMNERDLTQALTKLLGRKVWVTTDGPEWQDAEQL